MTPLRTAIAVAAFACMASHLGAQANPDEIKHRNDCRLAAQTLTTGHPAPKTEWAFSIISSCGTDGVQALADAIRSMRTSVDTGFLSNLRQQSGQLADGGIFASALSVAGDGSASVPARAFALLTVQSIVAPSWASTYADATSGFDAAGTPACSRIRRLRTDSALRPGATPLPTDYVVQAHALAAKLQRDASVPQLVRGAAQCPM